LYSLSWFPNPEFSKLFPTQREILAYIQRVAVAHGVPEQTKFRTEWKGAKWMESSSTWHVYLYDLNTEQEFCHEAKLLISGVGGYTNPNLPVLPGLESFEGPVVHTAKWDKEYNLRGLNVAVIGNGCLLTPYYRPC
jgi:cation diffusion facilitator CzcD-associated flavoprotein CzcO